MPGRARSKPPCNDHLFQRQVVPLPARAGAQQRACVVPGAQGRLRSACTGTVPATARGPAAGARGSQRALPLRSEAGRGIALPPASRHPFRQRQDAYKRWQGARLFHARGRQVEAPSFYLHLEPGACFIGAGLWHPESATQRTIRQFIFDNPGSWKAAAHAPAFRRRFEFEADEKLVRPPRGFPADFEFIDDLKHRNFVAVRVLDDAVVTGPKLRQVVEKDLQGLAPFVDYLCAALDLEF